MGAFDTTLPGWQAKTPAQYSLDVVPGAVAISNAMNQGFAAGSGAAVSGFNAGENKRHNMASEKQQQSLLNQRTFDNVAPSESDWSSPSSGWMLRRQEGGPVPAGTPTLVGENGPEVIVPQTNAVVIPNPKDQTQDKPAWLAPSGSQPAESIFSQRPQSSGEFVARLAQARNWKDLEAIKSVSADVAVKYPWVRKQISDAEVRINRQNADQIQIDVNSGVNKAISDTANEWIEANSRGTAEERAALAVFADAKKYPPITTAGGFTLPNPEATIGVNRILQQQDARIAKENGLVPTGTDHNGRLKYGRPYANELKGGGDSVEVKNFYDENGRLVGRGALNNGTLRNFEFAGGEKAPADVKAQQENIKSEMRQKEQEIATERRRIASLPMSMQAEANKGLGRLEDELNKLREKNVVASTNWQGRGASSTSQPAKDGKWDFDFVPGKGLVPVK